MGLDLNDPSRAPELAATIERKAALRDWYDQVYAWIAREVALAPSGGVVVELGSGAGFARRVIPGLVTSDVLEYPGLDVVFDARAMPFRAGSVRAFVMVNVFHHVPDASSFLAEAERCLRPGGRLIMLEPHRGLISSPILRYVHHEPFDPAAPTWGFDSDGPLTGANAALPWIVFQRDAAELRRRHAGLRLDRYRTFSPLQYWLSGGLKRWTLVPRSLVLLVRAFDQALIGLSPRLGSFAKITVSRVD